METKIIDGFNQQDWLIEITYVDGFRRTKTVVQGVDPLFKTSAEAIQAGLAARFCNGWWPETIKDIRAHRRWENKIRTKFSNIQHNDLQPAALAFVGAGEIQIVGTKPR